MVFLLLFSSLQWLRFPFRPWSSSIVAVDRSNEGAFYHPVVFVRYLLASERFSVGRCALRVSLTVTWRLVSTGCDRCVIYRVPALTTQYCNEIRCSADAADLPPEPVPVKAPRKYACDQCGYVATRKFSLDKHLRSHSGERLYVPQQQRKKCENVHVRVHSVFAFVGHGSDMSHSISV